MKPKTTNDHRVETGMEREKKTHQGTDKSWGETGESEKRRQMIQMRTDVKEPSDSDSPAYLK